MLFAAPQQAGENALPCRGVAAAGRKGLAVLARAALRAGVVIDHAALRLMQRTISRGGPRAGADARERLLSLAAHYRAVDLFVPPQATQYVVEERPARRGSRVVDVSYASRYRPSMPSYVDEYAS